MSRKEHGPVGRVQRFCALAYSVTRQIPLVRGVRKNKQQRTGRRSLGRGWSDKAFEVKKYVLRFGARKPARGPGEVGKRSPRRLKEWRQGRRWIRGSVAGLGVGACLPARERWTEVENSASQKAVDSTEKLANLTGHLSECFQFPSRWSHNKYWAKKVNLYLENFNK